MKKLKLPPKSATPVVSMSSSSGCMRCGSGHARLKHVTRSYGKGSDLLVIENIPMWSCPSCGEFYFSAQTLHEVERIKALRKSVAKLRPVPVAAFETAAA
jgi:YgiT-type zinc finger domain-containing protein